ncbi:hypothetical protein JOB18_016904 [Solea senegalensis]|uniref:Uncharacterized protein n=1 Tax=Solea senegalensis TaxID=28829 RepID=A0AAV6RI14_SOLSE|nr:uncharacterized protein LOC122785916 [Solea senegalensis]KAG7504779.1 hypothetical protein JOB18_016904 [Solea senegalensis]
MTAMTYILVYVIAILLSRVYTLEKVQKNIACHVIETQDGFKFPLECPAGNEIAAYRDKIKIAIVEPSGQKKHSPEVMSIDDNSIVTKECRDIQINCLIYGEAVRESWFYYKTDKKRPKRWSQTSDDRNISCPDITTQGGFKFPLECPVGSDITVHRDKITIATVIAGKNPNHSSEVESIDEGFIIMKQCRDIQIHCFSESDQHMNESWLNYKTANGESKGEGRKGIDPGFPKAWTIGLSVAAVITLGIIVVGLFVYLKYNSWKRKITEEQQGAATVSGFIRHLSVSIGFRSRETGSHDEERGQSEGIRMENIQPPSVEDTHSIDSEPDGLTPHADRLDLHDEGIQKGHNTAPEGASHYRAMNRNLTGDPGGVNDVKDDARIGEINSECLPRGSAAHDTEEQPLLSAQRVNDRGSDVTGESAALLKSGGGTDQDFDAGAELDTDAELVLKLKNS